MVLLGLFALGLFITVIQIVRIQTIKQLEKGTVDSAKLIMWSMVENNLGIVVSCIPTFAPLVRWPRSPLFTAFFYSYAPYTLYPGFLTPLPPPQSPSSHIPLPSPSWNRVKKQRETGKFPTLANPPRLYQIKYFHEKSRRGTNTSGAGGTRTRKSGYGLQAWRQSRRLSKFLPHHHHHHQQAAQPLGSVVDGREFDVSGPPSRQDARPASRYSLTPHKGVGGGSGSGSGRLSMSRRRSSSEDNDDDDKAAGPGILCQTEIHIETEEARPRPPPLPLSLPLSSSVPAMPSPLGLGGRRSPSMIAPRSPGLHHHHHMGAGGCPLPSPRAASKIAPRSPAAVTFAAEPRAP